MYCPKCKKPFIIVEYKSIEVDYCIHCKGIWFDHTELSLLSKVIPEINFSEPSVEFLQQVKTDEEIRKCPRCMTNMDKVTIKGKPPILDYCPNNHGYWFDANELQEYVKNNKTALNDTPVTFLQEILN